MLSVIIIALIFTFPAVELAEEWRKSRAARRHLSEMRKHVELHHRLDVSSGQWVA
jgi:hypothetical protein